MPDPLQNYLNSSKTSIQAILKSMDFCDLTSFLSKNRFASYKTLSKILGGAAPIQIIHLQFEEAKSNKTVTDTLKDFLCREIVDKFPEGWGIAKDPKWQAIHALSAWSSMTKTVGGLVDLDPFLTKVSKYFLKNPPPTGWIPSDQDISYLERVFEKYWVE